MIAALGGLPRPAVRSPGGGSARKRLTQGSIPESEISHCARDDKGEVGQELHPAAGRATRSPPNR